MTVEEYKVEVEKPKETLSFSEESVVEYPKVIPCVVIDLSVTTASKVFGEKAKDKDQPVLKIVVENNDENFRRVIPINFYGYEKIPAHTIQGKIIKRYSGLKIGTELEVTEKDFQSGFYKVVL
jgi:hypothetical protein